MILLTLRRGLLSMYLVRWVFSGPLSKDAGIQCHASFINYFKVSWVGAGGGDLDNNVSIYD